MAVLRERRASARSSDDPLLDANVARDARGFLDEGRSAIRRYSARGETMGSELRVAIRAFATPPRMVVFGAIDFSAALAAAATQIGYRVTIVDARRAFAQSPRFAEHAEVVVAWPQRVPRRAPTLGPRDAVLVFTHDPKFDEPAPARRAGDRRRLHRRAGQPPHPRRPRGAPAGRGGRRDLDRISSPCGLDVGARTPGRDRGRRARRDPRAARRAPRRPPRRRRRARSTRAPASSRAEGAQTWSQ